MPRNSSGVMSLPSGNPVVPGTLIESTWANPTMSDIANEITQSLPRNGSASMLGPLILSRDGILPKEATTVDQLNGAIAGSNNYMPAGAVQYFAMVAIPSGWLEANGSEVSRTTYANLFATIGTVFGTGNGTTTFNLPDLRGVFPRGFDNGRSVDPGRVFGSLQAGSNAAHNHTITDSGHTHTQTAHAHGVNDPGHAHFIAFGTGLYGPYPGADTGHLSAGIQSEVSNTGISIQNATPGIQASATGISVQSSGGEARPVNVALVACIKAFGALQTDGLGTMAFQNKDAVSITGGQGVFSSLQCTKVPTDPNDVARLSDVGGVDEIYSSDIQTVVVDSTNPLIPVIRPQTNVPNGLAKLNSSGQIPTLLIPVTNINYQGPWDASTGNTPSQEYPLVTFNDGDTYQISVLGTLTVFGADGIATPTPCVVGSSITYTVGSPTFPTAGWYYNPPVSFSGAAASGISFTPVGGISANNVQSAVAELDSETSASLLALQGNFSSLTEPSSPAPYQWWADETSGILKQRNSGNTAWIDVITMSTGKPVGMVIGTDVQAHSAVLDGIAAGTTKTSFRNVLINCNFQINQLTVSGTVTLTAGVYGHDGFKAGAGGCTYTFTTVGGITTLTITAGTLVQIANGKYLQSGAYVLGWNGTAQGRIDSGAYAVSPISGTAVAGTNQSCEWGVGTLSLPQYEPGSIRTTFEFRDDELQRCQKYYYENPIPVGIGGGSNVVTRATAKHPVEMNTIPAIALSGVVFWDGTNIYAATGAGSTTSTTQWLQLDLVVGTTTIAGRSMMRLAESGKITVSARL